jgi:NAD(P)-dependent dehydrogenase (short-subunit alcohol dehydrogenase family)
MLSGKAAVVTGSTSGIGLGTARALAADGADILLNGFGDTALMVALETATTGITCNAICPGWVLTPLVQKQIDDRVAGEKLSPEAAKIKLLEEKQPSLEFATPEQIGTAALFLCSQAAAQIRGTALPIDGGWTAQ